MKTTFFVAPILLCVQFLGFFAQAQRGESSESNEQVIFGTYDFVQPRRVVDFCLQNGIEMHGHPVVWANDRFTPPWVLNVTGNQAVSLLRNHVWAIELDIVMDERNLDGTLPPPKTVYNLKDLARQAAAYLKIATIFSRAERCLAMQFWGVSDKQSWLGAERKPLLFDRLYRKKPAYDALRGVLSNATP